LKMSMIFDQDTKCFVHGTCNNHNYHATYYCLSEYLKEYPRPQVPKIFSNTVPGRQRSPDTLWHDGISQVLVLDGSDDGEPEARLTPSGADLPQLAS
jgi:hypothetical protein